MSEKSLAKMVAIVGLVSMVLPCAAYADYLTGFESSDGFVAGQTVNGVGGWTVKEQPTYCIASDSLPYSGLQSLQVGTTEKKVCSVWHEITPATSATGSMRFEARVAVGADAAPLEGLLYLGSGASISSSNAAVQVWFDRNGGNLLYKDGSTTKTIGAYTAGQYYHVVADIDLQSDKFDLTVVGQGVNFSSQGVAFRKTTDVIDWICVNSYTSSTANGGHLFVDDVSVVPEPGTLVVLATGAAAMIRRRR